MQEPRRPIIVTTAILLVTMAIIAVATFHKVVQTPTFYYIYIILADILYIGLAILYILLLLVAPPPRSQEDLQVYKAYQILFCGLTVIIAILIWRF